ncbi:dethiobiotin synthase [Aquifex pyrophilus]
MELLITGTDTGVGKTFITYNLAKAFKEKGKKVACYKPVETYVRDIPEDGKLLSEATGQSIDEVVPVQYSLPLSPYAAILEERKDFSLDELKERFERLKENYEVVLVEGAGGLAVPVKRNYTYLNLAKDWNLPILIVARAGLGTLNHTYLTWYYAKTNNVPVIGIILNGSTGEDVSERTNPLIVEEMTGIKPLVIPKVKGKELPPELREKLYSYILSGLSP